MAWSTEQARDYGRRWYAEHKDEQLARAKVRHAANPEARRRSWLTVRLRKYGLTYEQYLAMLEDQNYECKICHVPEPEAPKGRLAVDHDHATGRVRGLLCWNCNSLLGHAHDSRETLRLAIAYLGDG